MTTTNTSLTVPAAIPEPRKKPLDGALLERLEADLAKAFTITPKTRTISVPVKDDEGKVYRHESQTVPDGLEFKELARADQKVLDALRRPVGVGFVNAHMTRLEAHLKFTRGPEAFSLVVEDVERDLAGVSEWAVVMACRCFRNGTKPWFPDTPEFIAEVKRWNDLVKQITAPKPLALPPHERKKAERAKEERKTQTPEMKATVADLLHKNGVHRGDEKRMSESCTACREIVEKRKEKADAN